MATCKVLPLEHRKLKDNSFPIYLRVIHNRTKKEYSLKMKCDPSNYDLAKNRFKRDKESNHRLIELESKALGIINELDDLFCFEHFEKKFFNSKAANRQTIQDTFEGLIEKLTVNNQLGSAKAYTNTYSAFNKFVDCNKLGVKHLDTHMISDFKAHLENSNLSKATIGIYLRTLRAAYNKAISEQNIKTNANPFKGIKIPTGNKGKVFLGKDEMFLMYNFKTKNRTTRRSLDWFMLSYLCRGINFIDLINLKWKDNIKGDRIIYQRTKTARSSQDEKLHQIKLTPIISEILAKYKVEPSPYLLPVLEEGLDLKTARYRCYRHLKVLNKHIKTVAKELNLPQWDELTFYCARHSYANVLHDSGVSLNLISECMGHSSVRTTKNYVTSLNYAQIDQSDELLY